MQIRDACLEPPPRAALSPPLPAASTDYARRVQVFVVEIAGQIHLIERCIRLPSGRTHIPIKAGFIPAISPRGNISCPRLLTPSSYTPLLLLLPTRSFCSSSLLTAFSSAASFALMYPPRTVQRTLPLRTARDSRRGVCGID